MKARVYVAGAVALLAASLILAGCGSDDGSASASRTPETAQKLCPVMGDPIDKDIYVDHDGRRVYFCCKLCPSKFKKDPAKYLKTLDKQLETDMKHIPESETHEDHSE